MAITNNSLNTYCFLVSGRNIDLYPGINILSEKDETYLEQDDRVIELIEYGVLSSSNLSKKVYTDNETGVSYIDNAGVKIPVTEQGKEIQPIVNDESDNKTDDDAVQRYTLNKKFKAAELKKLGVTAENATRIIANTPADGYNSIEQIPDIGDDDLQKLVPVFTSEPENNE
jgi:hypothetical protein